MGSRLRNVLTQIPIGAIEPLLGHDPRSRLWKKLPDDIHGIYDTMQRPTAAQRIDGVVQYIQNRIAGGRIIGAFPSISIAVQHHVDVLEVEDPRFRGLAMISIDLSSRNHRIVVDGLARVSASLNLLEMCYSDDLDAPEKARLREIVQGAEKKPPLLTLPLVIYGPAPGTPSLDVDDLGQLFHDFNFKALPVTGAHAVALDTADLHIRMTNALAKECAAIRDNGGMKKKSASLGTVPTHLVTQPVLLRFVRGACEGPRFQESNRAASKSLHLREENFEEALEGLSTFLDTFASAMGGRFTEDRQSLHLSSAGWQAIGLVYYDVTRRLKDVDVQKFAAALARIDWSRTSSMFKDLMMERTNKKSGEAEIVFASSGVYGMRQITDKLRTELHVHELLEEQAKLAA